MDNDANTGDRQSSDMLSKDKKTRTRSGCLNCRRRRRKCDETKPTCLNCAKRNETCQRGLQLTFRAENAHTVSDSELVEPARKRPRHFEILNETTEVIDQYHQYSPSHELNRLPTPSLSERAQTSSSKDGIDQGAIASIGDDDGRLLDHGEDMQSPVAILDRDLKVNHGEFVVHSSVVLPEAGEGSFMEQRAARPSTSRRHLSNTSNPRLSDIYGLGHNPTESAAENLLYLRNIRQNSNLTESLSAPGGGDSLAISPTFSSPINQITPDSFFDDGIFLPGSTYRELHTTLRQHLIDETNSAGQSREFSPDLQAAELRWSNPRQVVLSDAPIEDNSGDHESGNDQTPPLELSPEEEYKLWKNWVDEIACWLDKFDNNRHFQHTLPIMAKSCDHLRFSMLAVSARQIELKNVSKPTDHSLGLYQQAIHLLVPQLHTRTTNVLASCVVLCVLEMLSCSPKAWRRHLDGCAHLIQAVGINGFSGGVEQALFWCFARMDVCGGLIDAMKTLIPVDQWASKIDLDADIGMFRASTSFDTYANHAVYLCARVVDLLSFARQQRSKSDSKSYMYQWSRLWRFLQDWEARRPPEMLHVAMISRPVLTPFPTILFSNPAATSGNQLFHAACILLLQHKPPNVRIEPKPRPIRWHALQICGISLSNDHHGAWTNSIQPLWIAGKCMSQRDEHDAILSHLHKIETESGWGTKWRVDDLKEYWEIEYG